LSTCLAVSITPTQKMDEQTWQCMTSHSVHSFTQQTLSKK